MTTNCAEKKWVLAIDPGSHKVGYAIVYDDLSHGDMGIISIDELPNLVRRYFGNFSDENSSKPLLVVGDGTGSKQICNLFKTLVSGICPCVKNEKNTTLNARNKYFQENPPKGLRRLIPLGLQWPPRPIDDYAAWVIGEKYFISND